MRPLPLPAGLTPLRLQPTSRNVVISPVDLDSPFQISWLDDAEMSAFDVVTIFPGTEAEAAGVACDHPRCVASYRGRGLRWELLRDLMKSPDGQAILKAYEYIMFPDRSVLAGTRTLSRAFEIARAKKLALAEPAACDHPHGNPVRPILTRRANLLLRYVAMVGQRAPLFSREGARIALLPALSANTSTGVGMDAAWSFLLGYPRDRIAVLDAACVLSPRAPTLRPMPPRSGKAANSTAEMLGLYASLKMDAQSKAKKGLAGNPKTLVWGRILLADPEGSLPRRSVGAVESGEVSAEVAAAAAGGGGAAAAGGGGGAEGGAPPAAPAGGDEGSGGVLGRLDRSCARSAKMLTMQVINADAAQFGVLGAVAGSFGMWLLAFLPGIRRGHRGKDSTAWASGKGRRDDGGAGAGPDGAGPGAQLPRDPKAGPAGPGGAWGDASARPLGRAGADPSPEGRGWGGGPGPSRLLSGILGPGGLGGEDSRVDVLGGAGAGGGWTDRSSVGGASGDPWDEAPPSSERSAGRGGGSREWQSARGRGGPGPNGLAGAAAADGPPSAFARYSRTSFSQPSLEHAASPLSDRPDGEGTHRLGSLPQTSHAAPVASAADAATNAIGSLLGAIASGVITGRKRRPGRSGSPSPAPSPVGELAERRTGMATGVRPAVTLRGGRPGGGRAGDAGAQSVGGWSSAAVAQPGAWGPAAGAPSAGWGSVAGKQPGFWGSAAPGAHGDPGRDGAQSPPDPSRPPHSSRGEQGGADHHAFRTGMRLVVPQPPSWKSRIAGAINPFGGKDGRTSRGDVGSDAEGERAELGYQGGVAHGPRAAHAAPVAPPSSARAADRPQSAGGRARALLAERREGLQRTSSLGHHTPPMSGGRVARSSLRPLVRGEDAWAQFASVGQASARASAARAAPGAGRYRD